MRAVWTKADSERMEETKKALLTRIAFSYMRLEKCYPLIASTPWLRGDLVKLREIPLFARDNPEGSDYFTPRHAGLAASAPHKDKSLSANSGSSFWLDKA